MNNLISAIVLAAVTCVGCAQQVPSLSPKAQAVKRVADSLTPGAKISVIRVHAEEGYGTFLANNDEGLTFHDIDHQVDVTLSYAEVKKLKRGYGGYNYLRQTHTDRSHIVIVAVALAGVLIGLIAAAAAAK